MDYSNLCLIFCLLIRSTGTCQMDYWHVSKNGVLSHYRAKKLEKLLLNSDADFSLSTCNFYLLPQTNTSTPHTHYLQLVSSMVRLVSILYFKWTRLAKRCLHSAMLKYSISTRLTISVTRCRIFGTRHSSIDSCPRARKKP
jgi:hypothetical protein